MTRIAIELVPRECPELVRELETVKQGFPEIDIINIPDLLRYDLRSWEGCAAAKPYFRQVIPHIRAIDIDPQQPLPMADFLVENGIREVLVITGDPPQDMSRLMYPTTSVELIAKFKKELPHIKVYAGIDPYRSSIRGEFDYLRRKEYAGADGFFTQPFFDFRLLEIYAELLEGREVFWGVSPVTSDRSFRYWEAKNRAVFPKQFQPTDEWNHAFARKVLDYVRQIDGNIYFMPIRTDIKKYLTGIFPG